ncbi:MAG: hypothetical protein ACLVAW_17455 [Eisenbergiella massiliensis]
MTLKSRDENGNLTVGKTLLLDSRNCTAYSVDKLIAAVGVEDLIIVQAGKPFWYARRPRRRE